MTLNIGRISSVTTGVNTIKGTGIARNYKMLSKSTSFYGLATLGSLFGGATTKEPIFMPLFASFIMLAKHSDNLMTKLKPDYLAILKRAIKIKKTKTTSLS